MLGVVENPLAHAGRRGDGEGRRRHGRRRHLPPDPGRRVLRRPRPDARATRSPTRTSAAPAPSRSTCIGCGECMTGCRHNAKNTLVKNYLYLAEQNGATVLPLTTVTRVAPARRRRVRRTACGSPRPRPGGARAARTLTAEQVVFSASRARHPAAAAPDARRGPPAARLRAARLPVAHQLRVDPRRDRARTRRSTTARASRSPRRFHPDEHTHIEPVPLRQGQQRDVADADRAHRRRRAARRAGAPGCRRCGSERAQRRATCTTSSTGPSAP